jgi:hypothetical protein
MVATVGYNARIHYNGGCGVDHNPVVITIVTWWDTTPHHSLQWLAELGYELKPLGYELKPLESVCYTLL